MKQLTKVNKHARVGVKRVRRTAHQQFQKEKAAWNLGYSHGYEQATEDARLQEVEFMKTLMSKKNAKDLHGLIKKRIEG